MFGRSRLLSGRRLLRGFRGFLRDRLYRKTIRFYQNPLKTNISLYNAGVNKKQEREEAVYEKKRTGNAFGIEHGRWHVKRMQHRQLRSWSRKNDRGCAVCFGRAEREPDSGGRRDRSGKRCGDGRRSRGGKSDEPGPGGRGVRRRRL